MKTRKVKVTRKKIDELMALFRNLPTEPIGDHPTDDDFIGYTMETLTAEEAQLVDAHLASCSDCAIEMEQMLEGTEVWRGEQGKQRFAALRERLLKSLSESTQATAPPRPSLWERFHIALRQFFYRLNPAPQYGTPQEPQDFEWEEGGIFVVNENGRVIVRVDSPEMELEGAEVCFYAGEWQRVVPLRGVPGVGVVAEVVISPDDPDAPPPNAILRARLVTKEPDTHPAV